MISNTPCLSEVLKDQLYLGNLSAALSVEQRDRLSITHIISVCPDYPSTGPRHLTIPVEDSELENILIYLVEACRFIQNALDQGGRILLHCVMGISRSTTVLAAYLMKTRNISASNAIRFIKQRRPQAHPNYGFIKQLDIFEKCGYEPSSSHPQYRSWKRRHVQDVNNYLNHLVDTVAIIPDKLLMTSDFPYDPEQAQSLLLEMGVTHQLSISPAEVVPTSTSVIHHHVNLNTQSPEALLLALPGICDYICDSVRNDGVVLVHCRIESRACTAVCAYLMSGGSSHEQAFRVIQNILPLFNPTKIFLRNLEIFQASPYMATIGRLSIIEDGFSSQRQSNSTVITKSSNVRERNELKNTTQKPISGHGAFVSILSI
ncbi:phosphatases II [Phlegmacium glaucopus]|nr:phosphatases II [Phlegmacium glaucopus]